MLPPNVVVIGGGIIGASIGWHLTPEANVTFVAEVFGGVATPLSFAWINAFTKDRTYFDFRTESMDHWVEISKQLPDLPIQFKGGLTYEHPETLDEYFKNTTERGYGSILVGRDEIRKLEPHLAAEAIPDQAVLVSREGQMEAEQVALGLIHHAQSSGAHAVEATVLGFLKSPDGSVRGVRTSKGDILADHVVVAAGLGSVPLLAQLNITLPVAPRQGLLVNTLPTKQGLLNKLHQGNILSMRQTTSGVIRSGLEETGGDPGVDPQKEADTLFAHLRDSFRKCDKLEYGGYTIGLRPQPLDGLPILGRTGVTGLSVAVMHSGVSNGAIVGKLIAKEVLTNITDPLLFPYALGRF